MTSGVFSPGETVEGRIVFNSSPNSSAQVALQNSTGGLNNSSSAEGVEVALGNANTPQSSITNTISESATAPEITFRVAQSNHKYGPYNNATTIYSNNPYDKLQLIPSSYSSTSTILNVDTFSLSEKNTNNFFGHLQVGMKLVGKTSKAEATITNLRLVSDITGTAIGSIYIPNPNVATNPRFETGTKVFRLTSSSSNSQIPGFVNTSAEERFDSRGILNKTQDTVLSVRNTRIETQTQQESEAITGETSTTVRTTVVGYQQPANPAPVVPATPDPVAPSTPTVPVIPNTGGTGYLKYLKYLKYQ